MIIDLNKTSSKTNQAVCDILIIGAGTAGLLLAHKLSANGKNVITIESGEEKQTEPSHVLNQLVQLGLPYDAYNAGRFRCLGGTSTRWGGAMLPFLEHDIERPDKGWDAYWPISLNEITEYQKELETIFGLPLGQYEYPDIMPEAGSTFIPRLAKWPPFKLRNVARLLDSSIRSQNGPKIYINTTATSFKFNQNGRLEAVTGQSYNGSSIEISAKEIIIAAGAIESTRLLLLANRQNDSRIFGKDSPLGKYFHDHLSAPTANLRVSNQAALNMVTGFRFEGKAMRNLRFEPTAELRATTQLPAAFMHISFATDNPTGFDTLRDIYRNLQKRQYPGVRDIIALSEELPYLSKAAWWRFIKKRMVFPGNANFMLNTVIEQEPLASNRIGLSDNKTDIFGCPLATIDWNISDNDIDNTLRMTELFINAWHSSHLANFANLVALEKNAVVNSMRAGGGINHPGGSIRMGTTPQNGVVDRDLRTFCVNNLSVISTAVFPSGGGANPTMMLLMMALRLAKRIG